MHQRRTLFTLSSKLAVLTLALGLQGQVGPLGSGPLMPISTGTVIGTPQSIGFASVNNASSLTITTSAAVLSGDLVVLCVDATGGATISGSITLGSNTFTQVASIQNASSLDTIHQYYVANATAVSSASSLTITVNANHSVLASAFRVTGIKTAPLDKSATVQANVNNPSVATGVLTQAKELITGCSENGLASATPGYSGASGFTNVNTSTATDGTLFYREVDDYQNVNSTASVTYQPTYTGTGTHHATAIVSSFEGN